MATKVYDTATISLLDGTELELTPLKIKYLREFMVAFQGVKNSKNDYDAIAHLVECSRIAMKQYYPQIKTVSEVEDSMDLPSIYKLIDIAAGIKVSSTSDKPVKAQASSSETGTTWDTLDLAKLEAEVFLLGIWKNYEELEENMSMSEILTTIESKRDLDYQEKKFFAAIQGVDLESNKKSDEVDPWEAMKARVASGGATSDPNDILSFQGDRAAKAGFGIGMGLDYEKA